MSPRGAIVLIGFMGAGKTTAALQLAAERGLRAIDADQLIEARAGSPIAEIFARDGEGRFRALEEEVVCELLERSGSGDVVSLSGGAVTSERIRAALDGHVVVWLEVSPELAWRRVGGGRPLAVERGEFDARHDARLPLYGAAADAFVPASVVRSSLGRVYDAVAALRDAPRGARLLWALSASGEYPVYLGRGLLGSPVWPLDQGSRRFCVTDRNVAPLWLDAAGVFEHSIAIEPGEPSKTLTTAAEVWSGLARAGMNRGDHLVALGGGVVGDLAGFCAANYQRGVEVVQVPTTLAAQVDSAYGGKTGVDIPEGKNYVGSYHQPAGVIVDPATLDTLPAQEVAAGYAEVVKTALIAGGSLWERIAADHPIDDDVILDCARCKLAIVAEDERDAGRRQVLNLGHTVGHAIETVSGYRRYRHGEAVALGLLAALELSEQSELREQVATLLSRHGLPRRAEGVDRAAVAQATLRDKKRVGDSVPFVLVDAPGAVRHGAAVSGAQLDAALEALCG
ncbi:MAG TPA: bifunctional shikimate kinase/3-dehydroquinate synthase [Solirubrobacteraceae bacterium]